MTGGKHPGGRPRISATQEQVDQLRNRDLSWREIAKTLGISPATAVRLATANVGTCSKTQNTRSRTPKETDQVNLDNKPYPSGAGNAHPENDAENRSTVPEGDVQAESTSAEPDLVARGKAAAIEAGQSFAREYATLPRNDLVRIVGAFRAALVPRGRPGRKRRKEITAAYADWKSGLRGLPLYRKHIPGFAHMSEWKRRAKARTLREAMRTRARREQKKLATQDPTLCMIGGCVEASPSVFQPKEGASDD